MKKGITLILGLIFSVQFAIGHNLETETIRQMDVLKKELQLTEIQYDRIGHTINYLIQQELEIKESFKAKPALMESKLAEIKALKIKNLKGGLRPEQVELFDRKKLAKQL